MKKPFAVFLAAQSLSNFGDTLRVVAVTILLYKITGSGLSAGLTVFYSLIPGILLSRFAGRLGDIFPPKYVLVAVELIRSAVISFFITFNSASLIYFLLIILSSLDVMYNPAYRKISVNLTGRDKVLKGNSLLSGVSGFTNILGSSLGAIMISSCGAHTIFLLNSILHALSAILITFINVDIPANRQVRYREVPRKTVYHNIIGSFSYFNRMDGIKEVLIANMIISFGVISINMSFYPFAFDVLKVTEHGWGLIMSIFYTSNILAMLISIMLGKKLQKSCIRYIYIFLCIVSIVWFSYSVLDNLVIILLLQLLEGISLSLCGILLLSKLQLASKTEYLARITGISDFINNIGKLIGTVYAYLLIKHFSVRYVFALNSIITVSYVLYRLIRAGWSHFNAVKNTIYKRT